MLSSYSTDLAYLAGILDGEGTVSIKKYRDKRGQSPGYRLRVEVSNTSAALIDWIGSLFGGNTSGPKNVGRWLPMYYWETRQGAAGKLLAALLPFLIIKQERAMLALDFLRDCVFRLRPQLGRRGFGRVSPEETALREGYFLAMKRLNRRGRQTD